MKKIIKVCGCIFIIGSILLFAVTKLLDCQVVEQGFLSEYSSDHVLSDVVIAGHCYRIDDCGYSNRKDKVPQVGDQATVVLLKRKCLLYSGIVTETELLIRQFYQFLLIWFTVCFLFTTAFLIRFAIIDKKEEEKDPDRFYHGGSW